MDGDAFPDPTAYKRTVGALQHYTLTKTGIACPFNQLCQFLHCLTTAHLQVTKRVQRYLKGTPDHGLQFTIGLLQIHAYCDSDWGGDPMDRRSTTS